MTFVKEKKPLKKCRTEIKKINLKCQICGVFHRIVYIFFLTICEFTEC